MWLLDTKTWSSQVALCLVGVHVLRITVQRAALNLSFSSKSRTLFIERA